MYAHMPIIRDIVYGAVARGVSLQQLCDELDIAAADLNDSEKKLDFKKAYKAWEIAVKLSRDEQLGLHLGESTNPTILGLVGHLMQSSPTLLEAFRNVTVHGEVATNMFHYVIKEKKEEILLQFKPAALWLKLSPNTARHATEQAMAGTLQVFYLLSGQRIWPAQATLAFKRSGDVKEYNRVFHSEVIFKGNYNQLTFNRNQLEIPVISYDQSLYKVFDRLLVEKKRKIKANGITDQLRQIILSEFKGQLPGIEIIASRLNLTPRSLQRRLADENTSLRTLGAEIKKELAHEFLSSSEVKVAEVASLLGYSEASAFRRAYKTWTNKTPRQ